MKSNKYSYDYPENRKIGKKLNAYDRYEIARILNKSDKYIYRIFIDGDRHNYQAVKIAKLMIHYKKLLMEEIEKLLQDEDIKDLQKKLKKNGKKS